MSHAGLGSRVFAWFWAHYGHTLEKTYGEMKTELFTGLQGEVLEIGPGAGINFRYFPRDVHVIGVEPNPYMHRHLHAAADKHGIRLSIQAHGAEALELEDNSVDAAVSTLVLCSVDEPARVIAEVRRVLKPGAAFHFIEHVAAPRGAWLRRAQDVVSPLWRRVGDGCNPNRETQRLIEQAGFSGVHCHAERIRFPMPLVAPHIIGRAVK